MLTESVIKPQQQTQQSRDEAMRRQMQREIQCYVGASLESINDRLSELEHEWDMERVIEMYGSVLLLGALWQVLLGGRSRLVLPFVLSGLLLRHAARGESPLIPLLRRFGIRTRREIDDERTALKTLRGDYQNIPDRSKDSSGQAAELLQAQRK